MRRRIGRRLFLLAVRVYQFADWVAGEDSATIQAAIRLKVAA